MAIQELGNGMANDLDKDLEAAVASELEGAPTPRCSDARYAVFATHGTGKASELLTKSPERAADQLAVAVKGLLQLEQEFRSFAVELVGDIKFEEIDQQTPSEEKSLIPRLRSDAELIARLAIRMHRLIAEVQGKL